MNGSLQAWARRAVLGSARVGRPTRADMLLTALVLGGMVALVLIPWSSGIVNAPAVAALIVLAALVLPWRTRAPSLVMVAAASLDTAYVLSVAAVPDATAVDLSIAVYVPAPLATMLAGFTLGRRASRVRSWGLSTVAGFALLAAVHLGAGNPAVGVDVLMLNSVLLATGVGVALDARAGQRERVVAAREDLRRRAVEEERLRIARELHDVLAHNLTLVNAQASVAEYLLPTDPVAAAKALHELSAHTREALEEVRATIGVLREGEDGPDEGLRPAPSLARIGDLVHDHEAAGESIVVDVSGDPGTLPPQADAAAYRLVQEALSNARKHAPGETVSLSIVWGGKDVTVTSVNMRASEREDAAHDPGFGLVGMAERVRAAGGVLEAGPWRGGLFRVSAVLPTSERSGS